MYQWCAPLHCNHKDNAGGISGRENGLFRGNYLDSFLKFAHFSDLHLGYGFYRLDIAPLKIDNKIN